jgi:hypothetical protein
MSALLPADLALFEKLRIPAELVTRAGIVRVTDTEARKVFGIKGGGDMSGIAFPFWKPQSMLNGSAWIRWYVRIRRDNPDTDGKRKYMAPYADKRHFYFPPCPEFFADTDIPVALVEAEKSALALLAWAQRTGRKLLPIAIGGCWSWKGRVGLKTTSSGKHVEDHGVIRDLNICRDNRKTFVLLDSNTNTNPKVAAARAALVLQLQKQKAAVSVLDLPVGPWNGPDDFVGVQGDEAMTRLFDGADEGVKVLADVKAFLHRFVVITPAQSTAISLWVAHTFCSSIALWTPYLAVTSAAKRCGKSRLLETIGFLVRDPWSTCGASAASLFREIELRRPTLLFDELDALFKADKETAEAIRGILNSGAHHKGTVSRVVGQGAAMATKNFATFCPKALSGIGHLPDTVADRSLPVRLQRKLHDEKVERLRERTIAPTATELRTRLSQWIQKQLPTLKHAEPGLPDELGDRQQDGAEILLAIADAAGGDWPTEARAALVELYTSEDAEDQSFHARLLADIRGIFDEQGVDRIFSNELVDTLGRIETSPWAEWRNGKPMTKVQLARQLKEFRIYPKTMRIGDDRAKGYEKETFTEAWSRYLSDVTDQGLNQESEKSSVFMQVVTDVTTRDKNVTDQKSKESPMFTGFVTDVTTRMGGSEDQVENCFVHGTHSEFWGRPGGGRVCGKCHPKP